MRKGEWKNVLNERRPIEVREDPLHICSMWICRERDGYSLRAQYESMFYEYSTDLEELKSLSDTIYHHRVESYSHVLRARIENTKKELELATQLLNTTAGG